MRNTGWFVSWYLAVRAIRRGNRGTLALTVLIIALVVVLMNFLSMIIGGVTATYNQQMIDYQYGHLTVEPRDRMTTIDNAGALVDRIRGIPGVEGVTARNSAGVTITNPDNGKFLSQSLTSFNPDDEKTVTYYQDRIISGDFLSKGDTDQILIGVQVAGNEDEAKDKVSSLGGVTVGDTVQVAYSNGVVKDYRVKGIFETEGVLIDSSAFVTQKEMDTVMNTSGKATTVLVRGKECRWGGSAEIYLHAVRRTGADQDMDRERKRDPWRCDQQFLPHQQPHDRRELDRGKRGGFHHYVHQHRQPEKTDRDIKSDRDPAAGDRRELPYPGPVLVHLRRTCRHVFAVLHCLCPDRQPDKVPDGLYHAGHQFCRPYHEHCLPLPCRPRLGCYPGLAGIKRGDPRCHARSSG